LKKRIPLNRRNFIQLTGASLATLLVSDFIKAEGTYSLMQMPDEVKIFAGDNYFPLQSSDKQTWTYKDVVVKLSNTKDSVAASLRSPSFALKEVQLLWKIPALKNARVLGDAWERTYGDVSWQAINATKKLPWYCVQYDGNNIVCLGVKTGCNTICYWRIAENNLQLNLDTRTGGSGVQLGDRILKAAEIVAVKNEGNENPFATTRRFCKQMCLRPRVVEQPVYGINDWYFAYGNNSADLILQHTSLLAPLVTNTSNKPFSVIDMGWATGTDHTKPNEKFGSMKNVSDKIKQLGMRPGIWTRPLWATGNENKNLLAPYFMNHNKDEGATLDPTIEENIGHIKSMIGLYKQWGFEMVKHDYTTFDIYSRWGFEMTDKMTEEGWHFADNSKTNAEIILRLYNAIREAADDMYLIGCNTIGHLSAGLFELNRIGDDTSGKEWARTKKMGVNTMGFRMVQHKTFYEADGDCVGLTTAVPWEKNKQWMQLLAQSSAPLFISAQPEAVGAEQRQFIKQCFDAASKLQPVGEPLDWLTNSFPAKWKLNDEVVRFVWD
jgi:alpha-galactosidase